MYSNCKSQRGFTLIEMIVVMVITGILGGIVAVFIKWPVQGYIDSARRAEMNDIADTAMSRITRDLRMALPNSVRIAVIGSVYYLEFIPTTGGGRYRALAPGNVLNIGTPTSTFDVFGPMPTFSAGDLVVVDNTAGNSAYNAGNTAPYSTNTTTSVSFSAPFTFPFASPGNRFQVISKPISYVCSPVAGGTGGTLTRYWGYAIQVAQPTSVVAAPLSTATKALLATNVGACSFSLPQGNGLVAMQLTITESGENLTLYGEAHVANAP